MNIERSVRVEQSTNNIIYRFECIFTEIYKLLCDVPREFNKYIIQFCVNINNSYLPQKDRQINMYKNIGWIITIITYMYVLGFGKT